MRKPTAVVMAAFCALLALPCGAEASWARFALVVGHNDSDDPNLAPLQYADDDAVQYARLFRHFTEHTILLAQPDSATRRGFGPIRAAPPTRANVMRALGEMHTKMAEAARKGHKPVLYFVYSGHGNYDQEGRGYVHLADGRLTTRDLYYDVLGPSQGPQPHHVVLMVDACNAALLVNSRGGSDRRRVRGTSLKLESYPNVGVILSSSSIGEVHEWGRILSGIFSHEVRSALLGPGDLNDDGQISFPELAAFVAAANQEVKNEIYRIKPYIRPPLSAPNLPLIEATASRFPARVRLGKRFAGKAHLVDGELMRVADFHKDNGHGFWLGVPGTGGFALVHGTEEFVIPEGAKGDLELEKLDTRKRTVLAGRGTDQYFETRLFARAHGRVPAYQWLQKDYARSLVVERFEPLPWWQNAGAWSVAGTSLVAFGAAVGFHLTAEMAVTDAWNAKWADERRAAIETVERNRVISIALYSVGGAAAIGSALWFALDRRFETTTYTPPLKVQVGPTGVQLRADF